MIALIFTACSLLSGQQCKEVQLQFSVEEVSLLQCMTSAAPVLAQWAESHPNWSIVNRWTCKEPSSVIYADM